MSFSHTTVRGLTSKHGPKELIEASLNQDFSIIEQKDRSATCTDIHEIHVETVWNIHVHVMHTKYKTHYTVYTQDNQLNKNTLKYVSSTSGVRDLWNLLSDVKSVSLGSEVQFGMTL